MSVGCGAAVAWAERAWGRRVRDAVPLRGGWTSTMLRLAASTGEQAVLRVMTREPWRTHAGGLLRRESAVQGQLSDTPVPAPVSLAVDPEGAEAGDPAHLMTRLPGALELTRADDGLLDELARTLAAIHAHDPAGERPRVFQSWAHRAKRVVPIWARRPQLWQQAFELLEQPQPEHRGTFLHRDFHLGNVLWEGGRVVGVVDWVETSWGPAALDAAHAATYLAMLHGEEAAQRFGAAYRSRGTDLGEPADQRYWEVMDLVGYLPDPAKVAQPWRDLGVEVSDDLARARLERRLATVLAG
ncbi:phosphotransferase family protein [Oryzihumus leptocrescens]|uniref:Phosphotransferase family enzyme n=1 Tax=Oryzihumus leptocrescens TaxID=297536 RepID=A0A542ZNP9_9MICO|nr:aminoglycoside phosphotransferase family protein [Oryzihumus leptocrescens]TQL61991.1 phosphotransferase family enzyme [Oryzihumus leptocrescens]